MSADVSAEDLARAILPKSDQINADDLIAGPITVRILAVRSGNAEQPIAIAIEGFKPYYPCKSMLRVLTLTWGNAAKDWVGRSMTLYRDPAVVFGGVAVGGIRISHLSHLDKAVSLSLTATRGKRQPYKVDVLRPAPTIDEVLAPTTREDFDRFRASEGKTPVTDEIAGKAAAFLRANPNALEKVRAWVVANPKPTDPPASEAGKDEMP